VRNATGWWETHENTNDVAVHAEARDMTVMSIIAPRDTSFETPVRSVEFTLPVAPRAGVAVVLACDGCTATAERDGAVTAARVAFSCLVRPEPGDRVMVSGDGETVWIVAVLERVTDAPVRLFAEGNIAITSVTGSISLLAANDVNVDAGARVSVAASEIDMHAGIARFVLDELLQIGRRANLYVAKIRSVGEMVETFAEHVLTRAKRGTRFIEESDQLRAGDVDHRAEGTLQLSAKTAFVTADTVVRVDAEQIHMG
jgi:hypothetical protein